MGKPVNKNERQVDVFVDEKWESTIALTREHIDMVYTYMDLLLLNQVEGLDISGINDEIKEAHERSGL